ncbi:GTP-binding protein [Streptomyces sp. NPDC020681]|uniref:GTP-binding protein n=1 Tax=Streptomyces sp. NPDC020681 TaxID=3365083 RepID=UPI003791DFA6
MSTPTCPNSTPPGTSTPSGGSSVVYATSPDERSASDGRRTPLPVKIIIAGGFGVGKTTAVGSISDTPPMTTEAVMTSAGAQWDDNTMTPDKRTTTVAMDFGSVAIDEGIKLYLFGTPGQDRFGFMWGDLIRGALGTLVIVDTRRMEDCFPAVDYFEKSDVPFAVGVNRFPGQPEYTEEELRWALAVDSTVPVVQFDARDRYSVRDALLVVLDQALMYAKKAVRL